MRFLFLLENCNLRWFCLILLSFVKTWFFDIYIFFDFWCACVCFCRAEGLFAKGVRGGSPPGCFLNIVVNRMTGAGTGWSLMQGLEGDVDFPVSGADQMRATKDAKPTLSKNGLATAVHTGKPCKEVQVQVYIGSNFWQFSVAFFYHFWIIIWTIFGRYRYR